jgi:histone acetyltransferase (RNA polymerase elongator complex component)
VVVMVVAVMVVPAGCKDGTCANQQQNRGDEELLHAKQSSTNSLCKLDTKVASIKSANALGPGSLKALCAKP